MCVQGFDGGNMKEIINLEYICEMGDEIKMDLREKGFEEVGWIDIAHDKESWWGFCVKR
jgi:hypothetical protein